MKCLNQYFLFLASKILDDNVKFANKNHIQCIIRYYTNEIILPAHGHLTTCNISILGPHLLVFQRWRGTSTLYSPFWTSPPMNQLRRIRVHREARWRLFLLQKLSLVSQPIPNREFYRIAFWWLSIISRKHCTCNLHMFKSSL